jgi:hypothetical protein
MAECKLSFKLNGFKNDFFERIEREIKAAMEFLTFDMVAAMVNSPTLEDELHLVEVATSIHADKRNVELLSWLLSRHLQKEEVAIEKEVEKFNQLSEGKRLIVVNIIKKVYTTQIKTIFPVYLDEYAKSQKGPKK